MQDWERGLSERVLSTWRRLSEGAERAMPGAQLPEGIVWEDAVDTLYRVSEAKGLMEIRRDGSSPPLALIGQAGRELLPVFSAMEAARVDMWPALVRTVDAASPQDAAAVAAASGVARPTLSGAARELTAETARLVFQRIRDLHPLTRRGLYHITAGPARRPTHFVWAPIGAALIDAGEQLQLEAGPLGGQPSLYVHVLALGTVLAFAALDLGLAAHIEVEGDETPNRSQISALPGEEPLWQTIDEIAPGRSIDVPRLHRVIDRLVDRGSLTLH